ncbi:hypothetical protein DFQ27_009005 [Actinomortierella ambigua]|uniref:Uncharacterized protein n=1 Tax=Actinomortierella ambigua TaxID=1343610 RepID=A0A9P6QFD5_9FUNG|nr:hypothetical protein DFQ27_009005 [Actinomortierella ambigua]
MSTVDPYMVATVSFFRKTPVTPGLDPRDQSWIEIEKNFHFLMVFTIPNSDTPRRAATIPKNLTSGSHATPVLNRPFTRATRPRRGSIEQNALAHPDGVKWLRVVGQTQSPVAVPNPNKRNLLADNVREKYSPVNSPCLDSVLALSPYCKVLSTRTFVELTDSIRGLLNEDWNFQPQHREECPEMLSGSIVNTVEAYGRTLMVDAHCEPFGLTKGVAIRTSLPKPGIGYYKNVWPSTMIAVDGERLVIGTQSFDALVTSSVRLDVRGEAL